jgi:hypothetical protein
MTIVGLSHSIKNNILGTNSNIILVNNMSKNNLKNTESTLLKFGTICILSFYNILFLKNGPSSNHGDKGQPSLLDKSAQ